ncbi:hypothetical protein TEA_019423 [Camellia sinensis var. sinensis]|uniref:chitinase n=1 Tax=Camellia sinensis var. sinensis TaxID=542762 RepID=A0A4S4EMX7_CAMSN|nr:hypothetical protein TEA_019423 [Camellia sinensis var. sinensis]
MWDVGFFKLFQKEYKNSLEAYAAANLGIVEPLLPTATQTKAAKARMTLLVLPLASTPMTLSHIVDLNSNFDTTGDTATQQREIAAFLAQTSHETTGGWATAPDGPYAWGYCFLREQGNPPDYCVQDAQWPCAPGQKYYGRGPIQISYNYNYGPAGSAIGVDLLNNPDLVATDPVISFKTAIWFWMTPQSPKPSCHDVIDGSWTPSAADQSAGRFPGYGVITNIINGGLECGHGSDARVQDRIGFYQRYCQIIGVSPGDNLDCGNQVPFGSGLLVDTM